MRNHRWRKLKLHSKLMLLMTPALLLLGTLMFWLLVHVSGIPPLEANMLRSRGDAFRAYQARVGAFWTFRSSRLAASEK